MFICFINDKCELYRFLDEPHSIEMWKTQEETSSFSEVDCDRRETRLKHEAVPTSFPIIFELARMAIPMDRKYEKGEFIPIEKKEFGFVQQTRYQQPDLFHEEVVEIESPFAAVVASDTAVITFLVLGDQNAGKSTFLHTFTYPYDANFLELTSYLPILSSSFINTRFFFGIDSSTFQPMDELPFLDTDLGRMTVLITRENWEFFVDEFSIPRESFPGILSFLPSHVRKDSLRSHSVY